MAAAREAWAPEAPLAGARAEDPGPGAPPGPGDKRATTPAQRLRDELKRLEQEQASERAKLAVLDARLRELGREIDRKRRALGESRKVVNPTKRFKRRQAELESKLAERAIIVSDIVAQQGRCNKGKLRVQALRARLAGLVSNALDAERNERIFWTRRARSQGLYRATASGRGDYLAEREQRATQQAAAHKSRTDSELVRRMRRLYDDVSQREERTIAFQGRHDDRDRKLAARRAEQVRAQCEAAAARAERARAIFRRAKGIPALTPRVASAKGRLAPGAS